MMMAMIRLNTPSVFMYGGSILPGQHEGKDITVQDMFEAVGRFQAGDMSEGELAVLERVACPSAGACGGQFTANTMACVSEAIGLALFNSSGMPAPYESRGEYGVASGKAVMNLIDKNIRARDIVTRKSLENAARIVACTGGSTNAGLHLPADRVHLARRLRHLPRHALFCGPETGRAVRRQRPLRGGRRAGCLERAAQGRVDP